VAEPWDGFAGFMQRICELQAADRGLSDLLYMTLAANSKSSGSAAVRLPDRDRVQPG
jgi:hypothetical protein